MSPGRPASAAGPGRQQVDVDDLYDHAPCGYVTTLPDGLITDVNETFLRWTGYDRGALVGARRFADLLTRGARVVHVTHHLPALDQSGELREVLSEIVRADGARMAVMLSSTMRHDADGRPVLIRTTVSDATERRRHERELRGARDRERAAREQAEQLVADLGRRSRQQAAIAELGRLALADTPPDTLLAEAAAAVRRALDAADVQIHDGGPDALSGAGGDLASVPIGDPEAPYKVLTVLASSEPLSEDLDFLETIANVVWLAVERRRLDDRHRHLALHDPLTGLPNRSLLFDRLQHALARARRQNELVAVLLLDLDGFKEINDSLGHHAGDEALRAVADRLAGAVRDSDTVGRLGGDEFAVVCEGIGGDEAAQEMADRLAATVEAPALLDGVPRRLSASIGLVVSSGRTDPEAMLRIADRAMYRAKNGRRAGAR
ncbi:MAG TPA: sensor domain-containing diguanylate cyclase [Baekduia sp.]|nr:sensor domain-containing diguanylate cyclase [Baekduia sp.]